MIDRARILIVDDEPNVRLMFRTTLESAGYAVAVAGDGVAALAHLERAAADLVLLDLQMPVMGGMETLQRLRAAGNEVAVVIITAYGSVGNAVQAMKLGAIDFLTKPLSPESLRRVVAEVLARRPASSPDPAPDAPAAGPITARARYLADLGRARAYLNERWFREAGTFLKRAIGLGAASAGAHNPTGVSHEPRDEHDASHRQSEAAPRGDATCRPARHHPLRHHDRGTFGSGAIPGAIGAV